MNIEMTRKPIIPYPDSLESLADMTWKEFEIFSLEVIKAMYKDTGIEFFHTRFSYDDGSDGNAEYVVGIGNEKDLQIAIEIWLEVKSRKKRNILKTEIESHLVDACSNRVHTIIFVTNKSFSKNIEDWLDKFTSRSRVRYKLFNGKTLLKHADILFDKNGNVNISEKHNLKQRSLSVEGWFSLIPNDERSKNQRGMNVTSKADRPAFLNFDISVDGEGSAFFANFHVKSIDTKRDIVIHPYNSVDLTNKICSPGDRYRITYVCWPGKGVWRGSDFKIDIDTKADISINTNVHGSFRNIGLTLEDTEIDSQEYSYNCLVTIVKQWLEQDLFQFAIIKAPAGLGKSKIVGRIRRYWHAYQATEIYIDGEVIKSDTDMIEEILRQLLPFPLKSLSIESKESIKKWLAKIGVNSKHLESISEFLCNSDCSSIEDLTNLEKVDIASSLLTNKACLEKLVVIIEDLHKVSVSLLSLLSSIANRIRWFGDVSLMILATSRPYPNITIDMRREWLIEFSSLLGDERCHTLEIGTLKRNEAIKILQKTVPTLEMSHCDAIISIVGTVPFELREAILYLHCKGVLETDLDNVLVLVNPTRFDLLVNSETLTKATQLRIDILYENQASWLKVFLIAGAIYGRQFPIKPICEITGVNDTDSLDCVIDICARWNILVFSSSEADWLEFDHDLVRREILQSSAQRTKSKIAASLYDFAKKNVHYIGENNMCRFAYIAGKAEECLGIAKKIAESNKKKGRMLDVIEANEIAIRVIDPSFVKGNINDKYSFIGTIIDVSIHTTYSFSLKEINQSTRYQMVLDLLVDNLHCLSSISSGSAALSEAIITEARLLSSKLERNNTTAELLMFEGRMWFERDRVELAKRCHVQAEVIFDSSPDYQVKLRIENLIRYAICLRSEGEIDKSLQMLMQALRHRSGVDWNLMCKIRSNVGAAYLRIDWAKTRHHWEKQLACAQQNNIVTREIHSLASLSFVDLFEGKLSEGLKKAERGYSLAEELSLHNQIIRLALDISVHAIITGKLEKAKNYLLEAEQIAIQNKIYRRLFRVLANLSTVYELLGRPNDCYARDLQVLRLLIEKNNNKICDTQSSTQISGKRLLALTNIHLRGIKNEKYEPLLDEISSFAGNGVEYYAKLVLKGEQKKLPSLLGNYCITLDCGPRFLLSE